MSLSLSKQGNDHELPAICQMGKMEQFLLCQ